MGMKRQTKREKYKVLNNKRFNLRKRGYETFQDAFGWLVRQPDGSIVEVADLVKFHDRIVLGK